MGYLPGKRFSASSKYGKLSKVDGDRYSQMRVFFMMAGNYLPAHHDLPVQTY